MYSGYPGCLERQEERVPVVLDELDVLLERLVSSWGDLDGETGRRAEALVGFELALPSVGLHARAELS